MSVIINLIIMNYIIISLIYHFEIIAMGILARHGHRYPMEVAMKNLRKNLTGIG